MSRSASNKLMLEFDSCKIKITSEDIEELLNVALENGSLHWCYDAIPIKDYDHGKACTVKPVSKGGRLLLFDIATSKAYELDLERYMLGLKQALKYIKEAIKGDTIDISMISFDDADMILQLALFNEIRYE